MIEQTLSASDVTVIGDPDETYTGTDRGGREFTITRHGNTVISTAFYTDVFVEPTPEAARGTFAGLTEDVDGDQAHAAPRRGDTIRTRNEHPTDAFVVAAVNRRVVPGETAVWDVEPTTGPTRTLALGEFEIMARPLPLLAVFDLSHPDRDDSFEWLVGRGNAVQASGKRHVPSSANGDGAWILHTDRFLAVRGFDRVSDWRDMDRVGGGVNAVAEVRVSHGFIDHDGTPGNCARCHAEAFGTGPRKIDQSNRG